MLTRQTGRLIPLVILITLVFLAPTTDLPPDWIVVAQDLDYEEEFQKGRDLFRRRQFEDALKSFKRCWPLTKRASCWATRLITPGAIIYKELRS